MVERSVPLKLLAPGIGPGIARRYPVPRNKRSGHPPGSKNIRSRRYPGSVVTSSRANAAECVAIARLIYLEF